MQWHTALCVQTTWILPFLSSFLFLFFLSTHPSLHLPNSYCNTQNWEEYGKLMPRCLLACKGTLLHGWGEIRRLFHDMWKSSELWISLSVTKSFLRNTAMSTWTHTAYACTCSAAQERAAAEPIFIQKAWNTTVSACIKDLLTPAPTSHIMAHISHLGIIPGCFGTDHITGTLSPLKSNHLTWLNQTFQIALTFPCQPSSSRFCRFLSQMWPSMHVFAVTIHELCYLAVAHSFQIL